MSSKMFAAAKNGFNPKSWLGGRASMDAELPEPVVYESASMAATDAVAPKLVSTSVAFDVLVLLEFDAPLPFSPLPAVRQFVVRVNGAVVKIDKLEVGPNGHTLVLILDNPVPGGASVSVDYTDVSAGDDAVTLQGMNGADVPSFKTETKAEGDAPSAPELQSTSVAFDVLVLLEFDTPLSTDGLPAIRQFNVRVNGVVAKVDKLEVGPSGHTLVLTMNQPIKAGAEVTVSYTDVSSGDDAATLQGADGADVADFETSTKVEGEGGPAPELQSMQVLFGELVLLEFDAPLPFEPLPAKSQFTVRVNGALATIAKVSVAENGHTLVLTLDKPVKDGATVTVAYKDVSPGDDDVTLQGMNGADVADFQAQAKAEGGSGGEPAPQLDSMSVRQDQVALKFDAPISTDDLPSIDQFTVEVDGVEVVIAELIVADSGDGLILRLAKPVEPGATVSLAYADVSEDDDEATLQGETGADVADFEAEVEAGGGGGPAFEEMTVRGDRVALRFDGALSSDGLPSIDQFTVEVDGAEVEIAELALSEDGQTFILILAEPVEQGATVNLTYVDASEEDDEETLQGEDGADVADFEAEAEAEAPAPSFETMTVRGDRMTLKFDGALSAEDLPSIDQFTVTVGGVEAQISELSVASDGKTLVLKLAQPAKAGAKVELAYADVSEEDDEQTLQGEDGADVADFDAEGVALAAGEGPKVIEAAADGPEVRLVFDQLVDASHLPEASMFTVKVEGKAVEVASISIGAGEHELVLTLKSAAAFGDAVTVSYADPASGDDPNAIQTQGGVDADSFDDQAVQNLTPPAAPALQSATVSGASLVLTYDVPLDASHGPDRDMFWVFVDGQQAAVSRVSVSGQSVTLTLSQAVASTQSVRVSYFDNNREMDDDYGIQSRDGADAPTVLDRQVAHRSSSAAMSVADPDADGALAFGIVEEGSDMSLIGGAAGEPVWGDFV